MLAAPLEAQVAPAVRGASQSVAGTVTAAWDANTDGVTTGYVLFYGLTSRAEDEGALDTGLTTFGTVTSLILGRTYFFHVRAYNAAGMKGPTSNEISFAVPGDPCAFPLGATSVSIFVTGKLNKTGSQGPGSRAFITYQAASPNSPVVFLSIRANGTDIPDSVTQGTNLRAPGSLWFTIPPIAATYSVYARNLAGCSRDQATGFTTTVP